MDRPYFAWHPSPTWVAHLFKAVAKQHHKEMVPVFARFVPKGAVVLDVGAHAGQFAKIFSRLAGPTGRVYAFEPGTYARSILRIALHMNRVRNVAVVPMGLGAAPSLATMTIPVKRKGSYGFGLSHLGRIDRAGEARQEAIAVTTIDAFAQEVGLSRLDFIKADIEGWEMQMVRGARETLRRFRPTMMLEMVPQHLARAGDDLATAWASLEALGYRAHTLSPSGELVPLPAAEAGDVWWLPA
jgi:FkbM family methyltransferase